MSVGFRYIRIASKFWQDEKVKLLSDDAKLLYMYILTSPHSNMIGYYILPKPYVSYDLSWSGERLGKPFGELLENGLIMYCEHSDVVLVPNFLRYNTIQNANQAKGALNRLMGLPSNSLVDEFITVVKQFAEPFAEQLVKGLPERYTNTVTGSVTVTATGSEAECEQVRPKETKVAKKFDDDSIPMRLANLLKREILTQDPNTKIPDDLTAWATEADRMIRLDDRDPKEMAYLITWAQNHHFWQANVLSMKTFRKQYDKLKRQSTQDQVKGRPNSSGETAAQKMLREALEKEQGDIIDIE